MVAPMAKPTLSRAFRHSREHGYETKLEFTRSTRIIGTAKRNILLIVALGTTFGVFVVLRPLAANNRPSIVQLKQIADANGFSTFAGYYFDGAEVNCRKLIVSNKPFSGDDVADLNISRREHPSWRDRVFVMRWRNSSGVKVLFIPDDIVGDLHFFGDPEIIKALKVCFESTRK